MASTSPRPWSLWASRWTTDVRRWRLDLEYEGTDYAGQQLQPGQRTVQGELEQALSSLLEEDVRVHPPGAPTLAYTPRIRWCISTPPASAPRRKGASTTTCPKTSRAGRAGRLG